MLPGKSDYLMSHVGSLISLLKLTPQIGGPDRELRQVQAQEDVPVHPGVLLGLRHGRLPHAAAGLR
jgi:hypothetical protein